MLTVILNYCTKLLIIDKYCKFQYYPESFDTISINNGKVNSLFWSRQYGVIPENDVIK